MYRVFQAYSIAILCNALVACSPQFDWRTIKNDALGYTALFPSKPQIIERSITYQQSTLKQTLEFAKVDENVFAVMTTQVPANVANQVNLIEQMLQNSLLQQGTPTMQFHLIKDSITRIGSMGQAKQVTQDYYLDLAQSKKAMRVRWLIRPGANDSLNLYQISVIRTSHSSTLESFLEQESINIFFDGFSPN